MTDWTRVFALGSCAAGGDVGVIYLLHYSLQVARFPQACGTNSRSHLLIALIFLLPSLKSYSDLILNLFPPVLLVFLSFFLFARFFSFLFASILFSSFLILYFVYHFFFAGRNFDNFLVYFFVLDTFYFISSLFSKRVHCVHS